MPYRPEGNGSCKRFNRTLISTLGMLPEDFKSKWPQHISTLTYAYNCTRSNATGFSPYYLLYGRQPLLILNSVFTPLNCQKQSHTSMYKNLKLDLKMLSTRQMNSVQKNL